MIGKFCLMVLVFCLLALAGTMHAQVTKDVPSLTSDGATANDPKRVEMATKVLDEVAAQSGALRCAENRSLLRAAVAGLLWERDAERARLLFRESITDLGAISFDESAPPNQINNQQQAAMTFRLQLLQMVAQRDALLALDLLRSSAGALAWVAQFNQTPNNYDAQMEINLAQQLARDNPQLALKLVEARLEKGLSHEVVTVLRQWQDKDALTAMKLAKSVMERMRRSDPKVERQAFYTAIQLLQTFAPSGASASQNISGNSPGATLFDARALGEITEFIASGLTVGAPHEVQQYAPTLAPYFERYAPARLAVLKRRAAQAKPHIEPSAKIYSDFNTRFQTTPPAEMVAWTSANAPVEMRSDFYQQIAWRALSSGDTELARQIANDHITDLAQRRTLLLQIEQQAVRRAMNENRLNDARTAIARLGVSDERLNSLIQLVFALRSKQDFETARSVLADAEAFIEANMNGERRMNAQLQLAQACAGIAATRGFDIVGNHIVKLNDLLEHSAALDEFFAQQRMFKQGELLISQQNGDGVTLLASNLRQTLQILARDDFNRAIELADGIARPELRLITRILILQTALSNRNDGQTQFHDRGLGTKRRKRTSIN